MKPIIIDCSKSFKRAELEKLLLDVYEEGYSDGYSEGFRMGRMNDITITPTWGTSTDNIIVFKGPSDVPNPCEIRCSTGTDLINEAMKTLAKGKKK